MWPLQSRLTHFWGFLVGFVSVHTFASSVPAGAPQCRALRKNEPRMSNELSGALRVGALPSFICRLQMVGFHFSQQTGQIYGTLNPICMNHLLPIKRDKGSLCGAVYFSLSSVTAFASLALLSCLVPSYKLNSMIWGSGSQWSKVAAPPLNFAPIICFSEALQAHNRHQRDHLNKRHWKGRGTKRGCYFPAAFRRTRCFWLSFSSSWSGYQFNLYPDIYKCFSPLF